MENLVYHYTDLKALDSMVQNDKIVFWATRYGYLNDVFEKIWAQDYIQSIIEEEVKEEGHNPKIIDDLIQRYPYIISFCDIPDYRNMWRLYCNDGFGVCICLDYCLLALCAKKNRFTEPATKQDYLEHVRYSSRKDVPDAIRFWKEKRVFDLNSDDPLDNLYPMSAFIKCDEYNIENEVRYARLRENKKVTLNPGLNTNSITSIPTEDTDGVKYRIRGKAEIVPYIEIEFPSEIIKKIIIGYGYKDEKFAKQYVKYILSKNPKLAKLDIECSQLNDMHNEKNIMK